MTEPYNPNHYTFFGPRWLIDLIKEVCGDAINYVEQKPIPTKETKEPKR